MRHYVKKYWSFVILAGGQPLLYYPYKFLTKCRTKVTANILCDLLHGDKICIYDSRHYPELFKDLKLAPDVEHKNV